MATEHEIELCYYAEIRKPEGLEQATAVEIHEQYEYRLPPDTDGNRRGRIRVRKTTINNESSYLETIKTPKDPTSLLGDKEDSAPISEPYFNAWRHTFRADGQKKIRHDFICTDVSMKYQGNEVKLPPVKFEVDIFIAADGRKSKWAKIDIEVQDIIKILKEQYGDVDMAKFEVNFDSLPLDIGQVVSAVTKNSEERAAIDNFYAFYGIKYKADDHGQASTQDTGSKGE